MVSVGRGFRLSPNEEAALIQKEKDRRRKLRLQQVREQEKLFARQLRNAVSKKKQEEVLALANQLQQGWVMEQRGKAEAVQKLYHCNLQSIGQGHKDASEQKPTDIERTVTSIRNNRKAQERYNLALDSLHTEQDAQWQKENAHIISRQTALEVERARATKVAKLPPPEEGWNLDDEGPEIHTVKLTSQAGLSTTHYHVNAGYAEKASSNQQLDAREAAVEETERMKEEVEERSKEIKERHEKAVLRHKYAREKELLKQDYDHLMNELGQLEQMDRKRRQAIVASIPKQVFQPPHKRLEDRLEHQQNLEEAFEDMYMAKTDFAGDLTLALDPKPSTSDRDLDLTTESTIDTDILEPSLSQLPTRKHPSDGVMPLKEKHPDLEIPSYKSSSTDAAGLTTRTPAQFPVGLDRDGKDSPVLNEEKDTGIVEDEHPPAKKILPRSEALGRLLQRIRGQQKEISSQHEISSSTMTTTSSSSRPSDLSQHPIENSNGALPSSNCLSEHLMDNGDTQQNKDDKHGENSQTKENMEQGNDEMGESCPDEHEEPILAGSPTLLHPLEKAALIRAKVDLQKQTDDQAMLLARSKQQLLELRGYQENSRTSVSVETFDKDIPNLVRSNLPYEENRGNVFDDRQQDFQLQNINEFQSSIPEVVSKRFDKQPSEFQQECPSLSSGVVSMQQGLSVPCVPVHYTANQPRGSMISDKTLSNFSGTTRSSSDLDDPLLKRIRLYQQHLLQQHSKKKHISKAQKKLEETTENILHQQNHLMSTVPQPHWRTQSANNRNFTSVPVKSTHTKVAYVTQPQEKLFETSTDNGIAASQSATSQPEISQSTEYSQSTSKQSFDNSPPSFQSSSHQHSFQMDISTTVEPQRDTINTADNLFRNLSMPITQPPKLQGDETISGFYQEHAIRTKWLREQQELLRKQRETLLKHQEMQKRSLEEKQLQLITQLKGDVDMKRTKIKDSEFDSTSHIRRKVAINGNELIPTANPAQVSYHQEYPESTQHIQSADEYLLAKKMRNKDRLHGMSSAVGSNQPKSVGESVHLQNINEEIIADQTNMRQRTYPPVSIPKVIPMDVKFNTHELSTIAEVDSPKNESTSEKKSQSIFQDEGCSLHFKSLVAEENSDTNTSGSQVHDESNWKTNYTANQDGTEFERMPAKTVPVYDKELNSSQNEGQDEHSSKISPQAVIDISNPVIEQDFLADDGYSFLSLQEKNEYDNYSGIAKEYEALSHFKPHEFQSSTQISDNLESSISPSVNSVKWNSFTRGHVWKDLLAIPESNLPTFRPESLQDDTVQDQKSKHDVSTFDSMVTSRRLQEISRELQHQLELEPGVSNQTALSEYTIGVDGISKINESKIEQSTLSEYPDDQSPAHRNLDASSLISQPMRERYSLTMPISEGTTQGIKPDTILQHEVSSLYSLRTPTDGTSNFSQNVGRLPRSLEFDQGLEKKQEIGSRDIKTAKDVSSGFRDYSFQTESPAVLLHKLQAEHTWNTSLSKYSLDTSKDPNTPSQVSKNPLVAGLSSYSIEQVEITDEDDLERCIPGKTGTESELSQFTINASGSPSKHGFSVLSQHSFDPAKIQLDSKANTEHIRRFENKEVMMSRTSEESTISSINTDRSDRNLADLSDKDDFEHLFQGLNLKPRALAVAVDQNERTNTSFKKDVANQFLQLHETQDSTDGIPIGQDSHEYNYSIDSQRNRDDLSRNKDDLKRMIQAVISRRISNNEGLQMFSDISFSQHSLSSDGPSFLSRDLSQLISSRTLSGLGQVSEEERMDLPNGAMARFIRTQPSVKSQSLMSEEPEQLQMKLEEIHRNISEKQSPDISHSIVTESSTESSEPEQYVDQLNQLVQESKQFRKHHLQQKEVDLKKLERINEAYKQTEEELTKLLSQKKDESFGIMEEPDLTLVSIPDTTISEGPLWEASLSEGPISNIMSDSEIGSKLSEGQLSRSQMRSFEQGTTLSEGLLTENDSQRLMGLSESRIVDYSASVEDISESLLSFQKHECEVATPMSQTTGNIIQDAVMTSSSFQSSDTSSAGQASLSLQEAFAKHKRGFILSSKRRQDEVKVRLEEQPTTAQAKRVKPKKKKTMKNQKPKLDEASSQNEKASCSTSKVTQEKTKATKKNTFGPKDRKNSDKEKRQRNLRLYNQLEEVKKRKKEQQLKQFYEENRRKMKAFHDKVQSHLKQRASQSKK